MWTELIEQVLYVLAVLVASGIVGLIYRRWGVEGMKKFESELKAKQELARIAVRFVQQFYHDMNGDKKFDEAAKWLSERLKEKGIKVSYDEVRGLIDGAVREFKDEFGENWGRVIE